MPVKFEQDRMVQSRRKFKFFDKKHFLQPFFQRVDAILPKTLNLILHVSSFSVPKITALPYL